MTSFQSRFVQANGIRIHYVREGSGQPLLLLHGWPEFCYAWRKCIPDLARDFDVIAPDLRGFGDSDKPSPGPSAEAGADVHAADILALMDALALYRVGIVSHDVGAYVAQSLARQHATRVAGLFFFNCPYPGIGNRWAAPDHLIEIWYQSFHQQPWAAALVGSSREACRIYFQHFLSHWSHDPHAFDEDIEAWIDNFMKPGNIQGGFNWYISAHHARRGPESGAHADHGADAGAVGRERSDPEKRVERSHRRILHQCQGLDRTRSRTFRPLREPRSGVPRDSPLLSEALNRSEFACCEANWMLVSIAEVAIRLEARWDNDPVPTRPRGC